MHILFHSSVILEEGDGPPIKPTGSLAYMRGLIRGLRHIAVLYFRDHLNTCPSLAQLGLGFVRPLLVMMRKTSPGQKVLPVAA
jgi:hypothetical protein